MKPSVGITFLVPIRTSTSITSRSFAKMILSTVYRDKVTLYRRFGSFSETIELQKFRNACATSFIARKDETSHLGFDLLEIFLNELASPLLKIPVNQVVAGNSSLINCLFHFGRSYLKMI